MSTITPELRENDLFIALCEALRWWISFDAAQLRIIRDKGNQLTGEDVRRIAIQYNFVRNIRKTDENCARIAEEFNNHHLGQSELYARALQIINIIHLLTSFNGNIRLVSGATKIAWFVSPEGWTPFDRLTSAAVEVRNTDTQVRMENYYRALEQSNFLEAAKNISQAIGERLASLPGTKVLDKLLMLRGDKLWTSRLRPLTIAFADTLPCVLKSQLIDIGNAIVNDPQCEFWRGAPQ